MNHEQETQNSKNEENQPQAQKVSDQIDNRVKIIIAFFLGAILAGTVVIFALPILSKYVNQLLVGFVAIIAVLGILALIFTIYKEFFFKLFFGISKADVKEVNTAATSLVKNITQNKLVAASQDFDLVSQKGSAWYAWLSYRRWVVTVFYTLFLAFAGLLASVLVYNQNQLLKEQNELFAFQNTRVEEQTKLLKNQNDKIDSQIQLEESSRRGNLIVMMSNIMDKVDEEIRILEERGDSSRTLSEQLIGRIAALSYSFQPYRFWQDSTLIENPLSPERGQLLIALVNSQLDKDTYSKIFTRADFSKANLEKANLRKANLLFTNLEGANLKKVDLSESTLDQVRFDGANLERAVLTKAKLSNSVFVDANLNAAQFHEATILNMVVNTSTNLQKTNFRSTKISQTLFNNDLRSSTFYKAGIDGCIFISCDLRGLDFRHTTFKNNSITGGQLANLKVSDKDWLSKFGKHYSNIYTDSVGLQVDITNLYRDVTFIRDFNDSYYIIQPK